MFSVVIPLYNKQSAVADTLKSVSRQSYADFEVIVVDDGSTDESASVVENYALEDGRIRLVRKQNGGVCSARNRGIREAKGEYVALLDADDQWDAHYLEEQVKMVQDFPDAAMWGINFAELSDGKLIRRLETALPDGYRGYVENYFQMKGRVSDLFCSSSVVIRKDVFDKVGMFDERIKYAEDSDMWFRIIANYLVAFYDRYMVYYLYDAENRAMNKQRELRFFLPYYVDKYRNPLFKRNAVFYRWVMRWATAFIRRYYFSDSEQNRMEAKDAAGKLDYAVIPFKYRLLFHLPYKIARYIDKIDLKRGRKQ